MFRFTYTRGEWTDGNELPEWSENEEFAAYLSRIGYSSSKLTAGSEHGSCIEVYESSDGSSFYSSVAPAGSTCYEVFLPDFPSLMLFLKEFGAVFSALSAEEEQREILSLLEKLFRVYHGHDAHAICNECDPAEWQANLKRREARAKVKSRSISSDA